MNIYKKLLIFTILSLNVSVFSFSKLYFKYYTPKNGLLSLTVYYTVQDLKGYIWFATSSGLLRYDGYKYKTFLRKEGLPSNIVTKLVVDGSTLWIATVKGLCKMNLDTFKISSTYLTKKITALFLDSQQRLWVSQDYNRFNRKFFLINSGSVARPNVYTNYVPEIYDKTVNVFFEHKDKKIFWIGTNDGLYSLDLSVSSKVKYKYYNNFPAKSIFYITLHGDNFVFGTNDGIVVFDGRKFSHYRLSDSFIYYKVSHILADDQQRLWVSTDHGLKVLPSDMDVSKIKTYTFNSGLPSNDITHILQDRENSMWVSTDGGGVAKLYDDKIIHYNIVFEEQSRAIYSIIENGQDDVLWFGGEGIIANFKNRKDWTVASQETIVGGSYIKDIFLDSKNELWFLAKDISHLLSNNDVLPYSSEFFFDESEITSYLPLKLSDGSEEIWFGTDRGLYVFLDNNNSIPIRKYLDKNLNNSHIVGMVYDKKSYLTEAPDILQFLKPANFKYDPIGFLIDDIRNREENVNIKSRPQSTSDVWIATKNNGVYILDRNRDLIPYEHNKQLIQRDIHKIFQDSKGNIWLLLSKGMSVINYKTRTLLHYCVRCGISADFAWDIDEDAEGNIWLATNGGGISVISKKGIIYYNESNGLSSNFVYNILFDRLSDNKNNKDDIVWIVTNKSLDRYDGNKFNSYSPKSGLNGDLLGEDTPVFIDSSHGVWIGTSNGVTHIKSNLAGDDNSNNLRVKNPKLDIILENFSVNKEPYEFLTGEPNYFSYDQNYLSFDFLLLSFKDESGVSYKYYLEGFDDTWSSLTKNPTIHYDNLPSGDYTLKVLAQSQDGIWVNDPFVFRFSIALPFWEHPLFISMLIVAGSVLIVFLHSWNVRRLERKNLILEEKVAKRTSQLVKEKEKSDKLLLNVLPNVIAKELKETGFTIPRSCDSVTVLFTDFSGFTKIAEKLTPKQLVSILDEYFAFFDDVSKKRNMEKLKTIGDAYMSVGGLPEFNFTHPLDAILAAFDFLDFVSFMAEKDKAESKVEWNIRLGIHTGSVVAGVVGKSKFLYDIWGDAVNVASRMESSGSPGRINISSSTYNLIKNFFDCDYRGLVHAKNKGDQEMYFVRSLKSKYQTKPHACDPNQLFWDDYNKVQSSGITA